MGAERCVVLMQYVMYCMYIHVRKTLQAVVNACYIEMSLEHFPSVQSCTFNSIFHLNQTTKGRKISNSNYMLRRVLITWVG